MKATSVQVRVYRVLRFAVLTASVVSLLYFARRYSVTDVPTDGLDPELMIGEKVIVDEWGSTADRLEAGQFVIYDAIVDDRRVSLVGVVAVVPGGEALGVAGAEAIPELPDSGLVPETHAVILNGENSRTTGPDSRRFGPVDLRAIRGRIIGRLPF